jgi:hypothetical protein
MYEVRVLVPTLDDASALLKILGERGYDKVSMGPPAQAGPAPTGVLLDQAKSSLNKMNNWIMAALYKLGATERGKAATAEKIVGAMQDLPEAGALFESRGKGVVSRTVSMVASSVLGSKFSLVAYDKGTPRKFWLTAEGVKKARLLSGGEEN